MGRFCCHVGKTNVLNHGLFRLHALSFHMLFLFTSMVFLNAYCVLFSRFPLCIFSLACFFDSVLPYGLSSACTTTRNMRIIFKIYLIHLILITDSRQCSRQGRIQNPVKEFNRPFLQEQLMVIRQKDEYQNGGFNRKKACLVFRKTIIYYPPDMHDLLPYYRRTNGFCKKAPSQIFGRDLNKFLLGICPKSFHHLFILIYLYQNCNGT